MRYGHPRRTWRRARRDTAYPQRPSRCEALEPRLLLTAAPAWAAKPGEPARADGDDGAAAVYVPGEVLVKIDPDARRAAVRAAAATVGAQKIRAFDDLAVGHWRLGDGADID